MDFLKKLFELIRYGRKKGGLVDQTDDRSFGSQAVYTPDKKDLEQALKASFVVFNPKRLNQMDNDNCVGFGRAYEADATEDFEGESGQGSGAYAFAAAKKWSRAKLSVFGTSLLAGCMGGVTFGICSKEKWDYKRGRRNFFANWANIPKEAHEEASKHKAGSAWQLNIPWGWTKFDAILATLWHFRNKKVLIGTGDQGHRRTVFGYDARRKCLMSADTYGTRTYEKGTQYITRERSRTLFTPHFVLDIERKLAEILVAYDRKVVKLESNNKCWLVKDGEKHYIPNEKIAWSNGFLLAPNDKAKLVEIIEEKDLNKIPDGKELVFNGGKNEWIIKRIYELNKLELKY